MTSEKAKDAAGQAPVGLDLARLAARARGPGPKEAYHLVSSGPRHRLGVVVTSVAGGADSFSIELLLRALERGTRLALRVLEESLGMSKALESRGYALANLDDGWISCERTLPEEEVARECGHLLGMVAAFEASPEGDVREEGLKEEGRC